MIPEERILKNHYRMSRECGDLTRSFCEDRETPRPQVDLRAPELPRMLADFQYPVSPWPVLISAETKRGFARLASDLPPLLCRALLGLFEQDVAAFSGRYRVPPAVHDLLPALREDAHELIVRHDVVLVDGRPRVLETNIGCTSGGWELGWLWRQFAQMLGQRGTSRDWQVAHTNTLEAFLRHVHRSVHACVGSRANGRILMLVEPSYVERGLTHELGVLHERLAATSPWQGELLFDVALDDVTLSGGGQVEYRGQGIDGLLLAGLAGKPPAKLLLALTRAHVEKRVYFPDNPLHKLVGNKTSFALLHAAKAAGRLGDDDAELVDAHIPWSAFLADEPADWQGQRGPVRELALARKDDLVVKRGISRQGNHVFVGRFMTADEWTAVVDGAGTGGEWLVQEYCQPDRLYAPDAQAGVSEHEAVWGIFAFGREYGGMFGRLMEHSRGQGVVNSSRGAADCMILEV